VLPSTSVNALRNELDETINVRCIESSWGRRGRGSSSSAHLSCQHRTRTIGRRAVGAMSVCCRWSSAMRIARAVSIRGNVHVGACSLCFIMVRHLAPGHDSGTRRPTDLGRRDGIRRRMWGGVERGGGHGVGIPCGGKQWAMRRSAIVCLALCHVMTLQSGGAIPTEAPPQKPA